MRYPWAASFCGLLALAAAGCGTLGGGPPLRIGVTPDFPPVISKVNGEMVGLEADFAQALAGELGRPLQWVELPWERQIPALLEGKTDLVMAGMSVTAARKVQIDFCHPYMKSGLMALARRKSAARYETQEALFRSEARVGAKKGTTADVFAQERFRRSRVIHFEVPHDAALALQRNTLDVYLDDAPAIRWLGSKYEADLAVLPFRLTEEELAWGVSPDNAVLKSRVNAILAAWQADGTLDQFLGRWIPAGR